MARQRYALVKFKPFGKEYTYACDDGLKKGNIVLVGVGDGGEEKRAIVTDVSYFAEGALPVDKDKIRHIIDVVDEEDTEGEFYEDLNKRFEMEEPRLMNALWSRAEDYDEYPEHLPLYGDIEHKIGGRITVFQAPTEYVVRYSIRDFDEGRYMAYSKAEMLSITKNLKSGIDFYMRHRDSMNDRFVESLFKNPKKIPHISDDDEEDFDDFEDYDEDFNDEDFFDEE